MSANLWGFYRIRKTDGLVMIRCSRCGEPCYYDPEQDFMSIMERYTSKATGAEYVRPLIFFVKCAHCNPAPIMRIPKGRAFAKQPDRGNKQKLD